MVADYIAKDKDGVNFECSSRTLASSRLVDLQGMIRVMGRERFLELVQDLDLDIAKLRESCGRFTERRLCLAPDHYMKSLSLFHTVQDLSVVKDDARFRSALVLDFQLWDISSFSLLAFMFTPDASTWGCHSTAIGRTALAEAVDNLDHFMGCYYGRAFSGVLSPIVKYLGTGEDATMPIPLAGCSATVQTLHNYHDLYLWVELQRMLHYWSQDVRRQVRSFHFPEMELHCPEGCAGLLGGYARSFVKAALNPDSDSHTPLGSMEKEPHHRFYSETGEFRRMKFPAGSAVPKAQIGSAVPRAQTAGSHASAGTARDPPLGRQRQRPTPAPSTIGSSDHSTEQRSGGDRRGPQGDSSQQTRATEGSVVCGWILAGLLGVTNSRGDPFGCHGQGCQAGHPKSIAEVTRKEAFRSLNRWNVKDSLKEQVLLVASQSKWKET
jgi:hypothetical protein